MSVHRTEEDKQKCPSCGEDITSMHIAEEDKEG
jgi:hypothetical protein